MAAITHYMTPMSDETLYSWFCRLVADNYSEGEFADFLDLYLHMDIPRKQVTQRICYDAYSLVGPLAEHIPQLSVRKIMHDLTLYPAVAPFLRDYQQAERVASLVPRNFPSLLSAINSDYKKPKVCPICMKEQKEQYGFFWHQRAHQIAGVSYCYRHGVLLEEYGGRVKQEFSDDAVYQPIQFQDGKVIDTDLCVKFASFARDLLMENVSTDLSGTEEAIFQKLSELSTADKDEIYRHIADKAARLGMAKRPSDMHTYIYRSGGQKRADLMMAVLFTVFDSAAEFQRNLRPNAEVIAQLIDQCGSRYEIYPPFDITLLAMRDAKADKVFYTTPFGFKYGWRLPEDDLHKSETEKFSEIFDICSGGEYELLSPLSAMSQKITVCHQKCGKVYDVRARAFLLEGSRCSCESEISLEERKAEVASKGPYQLIRYDPKEEKADIKCTACGHTFNARYRKFLKWPFCRVCDPKVRDAEHFVKEVHDLVGDDYTVVGEYIDKNTKVQIRCNRCGKIHAYLPRHFLDGSRCRCQNGYVADQAFPDLVDQLSGGAYRITKKTTSNLWEIVDTDDGSVQQMTKMKILQELTRPTPSPILPRANSASFHIATKQDELLEQIKRDYRSNEVFFNEDIRFQDLPRVRIKEHITHLYEAGRLYRVAIGAYTWTECRVNPRDYLSEKYLVRHGKRIGFLSGASLAYSVGVDINEPEKLQIITNIESQTHGRNKTFDGIQYKIYGSRYPITEDNYHICELIDLVRNAYHFGWEIHAAAISIINAGNLTLSDIQPYLDSEPKYIQTRIIHLFSI